MSLRDEAIERMAKAQWDHEAPADFGWDTFEDQHEDVLGSRAVARAHAAASLDALLDWIEEPPLVGTLGGLVAALRRED